MKDYAPETGRTKVKGYRTKKARRRHAKRVTKHETDLKFARKYAKKQRAANARRIEAGWWPPTPLVGQPAVYEPPKVVREDDRNFD